MIDKEKLKQWLAAFDSRLKKIIGEENEILFHFVRWALAAALVALAIGVVIWFVELVFRGISWLLSVFIRSLPYLLALLLIAGLGALAIYVYRLKKPRPPVATASDDASGPTVLPTQPAARPPEPRGGIERSLSAADQQTRTSFQAVLASLQRFDHRLELPISPAHYNDIFGDNWVAVREFVESPQGRSVPEVAAMLLEIIILYKRAQDARWVPINHERIHAWWGEAARRRKWLSDLAQAMCTGPSPTDSATEAAIEAVAGAAHSVPPSLDELLKYYDRLSHGKQA